MVKEEKGFDAKVKGMYSGGGCACQLGVIEKKESALKEVVCKGCGKIFKTNRGTEYCWECEKKK